MSQAHAFPGGSIAPWAEIVPDAPPMTVEDLLDYPGENGYRYNPAPAQPLPADGLTHIDILTPNLTEAQLLCGMTSSDPTESSRALRRNNIGTVVLTLDERAAHISGDWGNRAIPAYGVSAVDTTGAGDAFSAALAVGLGEGMRPEEAVAFACAAGVYSVQSPGTVPSYATRPRLTEYINTMSLAP